MRNFNHLYYFYVVAKLGGFTAAAKQLNTSQSSLSTQMKTLEAQLGHELFKREGRKIVLTKTGQSVFSYCRRMFDIAGEIEDFIAQSDHRGHASFSIGVSPDIERPYVTDAISRTIKSVSATQKPLITQLSYPHEKLVSKLELGELDVVISSQPIHSQSVKTIAELKLPVKAVASSALGRSIPAMLEDPSIGIILASQDMRLRWETDEYLTKKRIRKTIAFESNVVGAIMRATIDGLGIGFLPEAYLVHELESPNKTRETLIVSREPLWNHRIYVNARNRSASEENRLMLTTLARQLEA
ncbi:LysR family transcriptional regulator [soil metagenome]